MDMEDKDKTKEQLLDELIRTRLELSKLRHLKDCRKQTEKHLKLSWRQLRLLIESGPDLFFMKDIDLRYQLVNQALCRFFGRDESEILGKNDMDLMPDIAVACQESDRQAIRERRIVISLEQAGERFYETYKFPVIADDVIVGVAGIIRDITERKRAEEALRKSEELQHAILNNVGAYIYLKDTQYRYMYVNSEVSRLYGVSEKEIIGKVDADFFTSASVDEIMESDRRVIEHGETVMREEANLTAPDAQPRTYWAVKMPLKDVRGNVCGLCGISTDITGLKRAAEELQEARSRLDEIIDYLPDATLVIDNQGKVIAWNKAMENMTGVAAADVLGKGDYEYAIPFYGERRPILIDLVMKPREDIEARYVSLEREDLVLHGEAYMPALRGGEVYLYGKARALKDSKGNVVGAIESIRDITSRRKAEEKYLGIFENAVMGIFHSTSEGQILSANPAFARILGYESPEEACRAITDVAGHLFVDQKRRFEFLQILNTQGKLQEQEIQLAKKDGSAVLVNISGRAVRDGSGQLLYYEGTMQDITERKRLESQLRQAQKMEAIGTLAGGIAHDFNNILASIMGYTEMSLKESRLEVRLDYLNQVLQASERAKNLVNQILFFSRQREEELRPLDIRPIVKEALNLLRATLPATIEIKQAITAKETTVLADPTQIHQIIMNLSTNAAHAMRENGGVLEVRLSNMQHEADRPDLQPGYYLQLSVSDTGHGIDAAIRDKIFDPFFTTKKAKEGTGLGLSVVYGIVKSCGGAIDVQSFVGKGTTMTIYLPCILTKKNVEEKKRMDIDLQGHERILFVDDEEMLVRMARAFFQSLGYSITATTSSAEALKLCEEDPQRFDLVITDMTMPEITGVALAQALMKIRPELPVILCTGYSDSVNLEDARNLNIREFCRKPLLLNDMGTLVKRILKKNN